MSDDRYRITEWEGHDNYECTRCPFATIDREWFGRHLAEHAAKDVAKAAPVVRPLSAELYDSRGERVEAIEVPTCGAPKTDGLPCRNQVAASGDRCHLHTDTEDDAGITDVEVEADE